MLTVACVRQGRLYGPEYVTILEDMVRRNLPAGMAGKFVCFTDQDDDLGPGVEIRPIPSNLFGWYSKLWLFSNEAFEAGDTILYFDLDTVITGPLDAIAAYEPEKLVILRDFYRPGGYQSSVMMWKAGTLDRIWTSYAEAKFPHLAGGDQEWIECEVGDPTFFQDKFKGDFCSFKVHARFGIPKGTKVVVFHGKPRPHEAGGWVNDVWKIGGGTSASLLLQANVPEETLLAQIRAAEAAEPPFAWIKKQEAHDGIALICAGGPSISKELDLIRRMHGKADIFAINGSQRYLRSQRIHSDYHIILDARRENLKFVPEQWEYIERYYSSQCHPEVLAAKGAKITCWHPAISGIETIVPKERWFVGGGTTAGMKAVTIAYMLGYRKLHLFGFDSCYADIQHHAYPQSLNDGERIIEAKIGERTFKCAPWMVSQAEDFENFVPQLINEGCEIVVHGDGLIKAIADEMAKPESDEIIEIDGMWWPEADRDCRPMMEFAEADAKAVMALCTKRKLAIQAGGNVGVVPKILASGFESVVTFEPEDRNWRCLVRNLSNHPNIVAHRAALGDHKGKIAIQRMNGNSGAHFVIDGNDEWIMRIDDLDLEACDLIHLDVEGYELKALKGSQNTIQKFSPLIVVEEKGLNARYGEKDTDLAAFLASIGYAAVRQFHRDTVYSREPLNA